MRLTLLIIAFFSLSGTTKAQCPPGAYASIIFYITLQVDPGGVLVDDTSNYFQVSNFQPGTTVYLYTIHNTLVDSVLTSANGDGWIELPNSFNDSLVNQFNSGHNCGVATNGLCTTNVGGVGLLPVKISSFSVSGTNNKLTVNWQTEMDEPGTKYIIQQGDNGIDFTGLTTVVSKSVNTERYTYTGPLFTNKTKYFRIKIVNRAQKISYTETKILEANPSGDMVISVTGANSVSVTVPKKFANGNYAVYNNSGSLLLSGKIFSTSFTLSPNAGKGIYFLRIANSSGKKLTKPFVISD